MLNKEPGPERTQLGFKDAVLSNFEFLDDFGLRRIEEKETLVRYESSKLFVNVYHGRASFELGVELGRRKEPGKKLDIFTIVYWAGAEKVEGFGRHVMFQVSSREGVKDFVPKLAALVKKYALPLLQGDKSAFASALKFQASRHSDEMKQGNRRVVRRRAEEAWHAKDFVRVIELYTTMGVDLTDVEAKKLSYARAAAAPSAGSNHK